MNIKFKHLILLPIVFQISFFQNTALANENAELKNVETVEQKINVSELIDRYKHHNSSDDLKKIFSFADSGNVDALTYIGELLQKGEIENGEKSAIDYYERAILAGNSSLHARLGSIYRSNAELNGYKEKALEHLKISYESGSSWGAAMYGDTLVRGDLGVSDAILGLKILEQQVDNKSAVSANFLGEIYLGDYIGFDPEKAKNAYQKAVDFGDEKSNLKISEILINHYNDKEGGLLHLERASEAGDRSASRILGEALISGSLGIIDREKGVNILSKLSSDGDSVASLRLGRIYLDGKFINKDIPNAMQYLEIASSNGNIQSTIILVDGHINGAFGRLSSKESGIKYADLLEGMGNLDAPIMLSNAYLNGTPTFKRDINAALDILNRSAESGNPKAARLLISLYRSGKGSHLKANLNKSKEYVERYSSIISSDELNIEQIMDKISKSYSVDEFEDILNDILTLPQVSQREVFRMSRNVNQNMYTYILQHNLIENGSNNLKKTGYVNNATIISMKKYCRSVEIEDSCNMGPLYWSTANSLGKVFYK